MLLSKLQPVVRHRARVSGAEERDRDRPGLPQAAPSDPGARVDLLPGTGDPAGDAVAPSQAPAPLSPERLLEELEAIQYHRVRLATRKVLTGATAISPEQGNLFEAIGAAPPTRRRLEDGV